MQSFYFPQQIAGEQLRKLGNKTLRKEQSQAVFSAITDMYNITVCVQDNITTGKLTLSTNTKWC